jgi:V8-like Glu-specific endopeptidase/glucan-binding YG repeat protein
MKKTNKKKLIAGLTTATLVVPAVLATTVVDANVAKADDSKTYNSVMYEDSFVGKVAHKKGEGDLGFRGYTPYGNKLIPQTPFSTPRTKAAAFIHTTYRVGSDEYSGNGSGVFIAPNVMLTVAHNYLNDDTKTMARNLEGYVYIAGSYNFPAKYYDAVDYPDPTRFTLPTTKDIDVFFRPGAYGGDYRSVSDTDIAVVVFKRPVQLMVKGAEPRPIAKNPISVNEIGKKIKNVGYPASYQPRTGVLSESNGEIIDKPHARSRGIAPISADSQGGNSGGGIYNENDEVIGSLVGAHNSDQVHPENSEYNSFTPLDETNHAWVKGLLEQHAIKGWYDEGSKRYYFEDDGQMVKGTTKVIGDHEYEFNDDGVMVRDLGVVKKGTLKVRYVDKDTGQEIKSTETVFDNIGVGKDYDLNEKKDALTNNYEFLGVADGGSLIGKLEEGEKTITLEFRHRKGNLKVVYKGTDGKELAVEEVRDQKYGVEYTAPKKDFTGYELQGELPKVTVSKAEETIEVIYKKLEKGQVNVRYVNIDENDKVLGEVEVTKEVYENEEYEIVPKTFDNLDYVGVRGNDTLRGRVGAGSRTITLEYRVKRGTLEVNYRSGDKILKTERVEDLKYGTTHTITKVDFEGYVPKVETKDVTISKPNEVVDFEYDRIKHTVTVVYKTDEGEVLDRVTKEVFYGEEFTPEQKNFEYVDYVSGADKQEIKSDKEITVTYKRQKAGLVNVVYKKGEEIVKTVTIPTTETGAGKPYKIDESKLDKRFEVAGRTFIVDKLVSGALEGKTTAEGVEVVYSVKEETTKDVEVGEDIDFGIKYEDSNIDHVGFKQILKLGVKGHKTTKYKVVYVDGVEVSRTQVGEPVQDKAPVDQIERRGTLKPEEGKSAAVVVYYKYKDGDITKKGHSSTLVFAGSPLGTPFKNDVNVGDYVDLYGQPHRVLEVEKPIEGVSTSEYQEFTIKVARTEVDYKFEDIEVPYGTTYVEDDTLPVGEEREVVKGEDGLYKVTYVVTYEDNKEVKRVVKYVTEKKAAVNRVVKVGRQGATVDSPKVPKSTEPDKSKLPEVDAFEKKPYRTVWVKDNGWKDVDKFTPLHIGMYNDEKYLDKIDFELFDFVKEEVNEKTKTKYYIYKDKEVAPTPEKPKPIPTPERPEQPEKPGVNGGTDNNGNNNGSNNGNNNIGNTGGSQKPVITGGFNSKGGKLHNTGIEDNKTTGLAGVLTLLGALGLGVFSRRKTK